MRVKIVGDPNFEDFEADLLGYLPSVDGSMMGIVACTCGDSKEVHAIREQYIQGIPS